MAMAAPVVHADVIVSGGELYSQVQAGDFGAQRFTAPANSVHTTTNATFGSNSSTTAYDFAVTGSTGHLQSTFTDTRAGQVYAPNPLASAQAYNYGFIFFEVTSAPVSFTATGEFDLAGNGYVDFNSYLTGPSGMVYNYQGTSNGVANETFTLGDAGGNVNATSTGALSGLLDVGSYTFFYRPTIRATTTDGGASASGFIRLDFGNATASAVPEPSTFAAVGLGFVSLLAFRRRSRR